MLSHELNTLLRGRTIEIKVFPLSFAELYHRDPQRNEENLNAYLTFGGLPELLYYSNNQFKIEYLNSYLADAIKKDIIERYRLRINNHFPPVFKIVLSSIGSPISAKKIANTFKSQGYRRIAVDTIQNYLRYMQEGNFVLEAERYDLKGRRYLSFHNKYYCIDLGIRNALLNFRQLDHGHLLENMIYNELRRRYGTIDIGINGEKEIDFVVNNVDRRYYIQVCLSADTEAARIREVSSFYGLDDGYKKIIIGKSPTLFSTIENGYQIIDVFDFLFDDAALEKL